MLRPQRKNVASIVQYQQLRAAAGGSGESHSLPAGWMSRMSPVFSQFP